MEKEQSYRLVTIYRGELVEPLLAVKIYKMTRFVTPDNI